MLTLLVGNIASGKSTWCKEGLNKGMDIVLDKDSLREKYGVYKGVPYLWDEELERHIHQELMGKMGAFLSLGLNVIFDETCMHPVTRIPYIVLAEQVNVKVRAIVFPDKGSLVHVHRRMTHDARGYTWEQWEEVYEKKKESYLKPSISEGIDYIFTSDEIIT